MAYFNKFSIDAHGNPVIFSMQTTDEKLSGTCVFDLPELNEEQWKTYWAKVYEMGLTKLINETNNQEG